MSRLINPYQVWLGLSDVVTAPNHFELLGLDDTEEDAKTIAAAADRAASRVRRCRPGEHATEWAALLDQIAEAKKCLTDPRHRSEYLLALKENRRGSAKSSNLFPSVAEPARAPVDPNMYPPGLAPAMAPVSSAPPVDFPPLPSVPVDPQAAVGMPADAVPHPLPMSPAGVPYLQPVDPSALTDPMHPAVPTMNCNPYSPTAPPVTLPPMAPAPMDYGGPMAAVPTAAFPMAAVPVEMPVGLQAIPMAQALPPSATAYSMATAVPASVAPATAPSSFGAVELNHTSAAIQSRESTRGGMFGPALLGLAMGIVLLSIGAGYLYWPSLRGSSGRSPVVIANSERKDAAPESVKDEGQVQLLEPNSGPSSPPKRTVQPSPASSGRDPSPPVPNLPIVVDGPTEKPLAAKGTDAIPAANSKPTLSEPPPTTKPVEPTKPEVKPVPDSKTAPASDMPAKTDELPKPTQEELTKLGRAMQKAREAIGQHDFDRAEAFLNAAAEMPRLPEHQAMLDRLKLLSENVGKYRKAIQESISKLAVASSFQVGEATVGVVETGPEKIILRVGGQNRTYTLRDLPVGLAAALAEQTLPPDDPKTLTLKGAFVMVSKRAGDEDLKKAREFLEKASGSNEAAKELLLLFKDRYDLTTMPMPRSVDREPQPPRDL